MRNERRVDVDLEELVPEPLCVLLEEEVRACARNGQKYLNKNCLIEKYRSHPVLDAKNRIEAERAVVKAMKNVGYTVLFDPEDPIWLDVVAGEDLYFRNIPFKHVYRTVGWKVIDSKEDYARVKAAQEAVEKFLGSKVGLWKKRAEVAASHRIASKKDLRLNK